MQGITTAGDKPVLAQTGWSMGRDRCLQYGAY